MTYMGKAMKTQILACMAALAAVAAAAQQPDEVISRQIEVTRQYVPEVGTATKLDFEPRMDDTVTLKPQIRYRITPTPWKSVFGTEPIEAVSISTAKYESAGSTFMELGLGYSAQSLFSLRSSGRLGRHGIIGGAADHFGEWGKGHGDMIREAPWTTNRLGLFAESLVAKRVLRVDLSLDADMYVENPSAYSDVISNRFFLRPGVGVRYGDAFNDFSRFNWRVGVDWSALLIDNRENNLAAFAEIGFRAHAGVWRIRLDGAGNWNDSPYLTGTIRTNDWYIGISPSYEYTGKRFSAKAGFKFYVNPGLLEHGFNSKVYRERVYAHDMIHFVPDLSISYAILPELVVYARADGTIGDGSIDALRHINPYVLNRTNRGAMADYRGGLRGTVSERIVYDAHVGYRRGGMPGFVEQTGEYDNCFMAYLVNAEWFYVGAQVGVRFPFGLGVDASVEYNNVNGQADPELGTPDFDGDFGLGIPPVTAGLSVSYGWKDRLLVKASARYVGERAFAADYDSRVEVPAYVDLRIGAEYWFRKVGVFAEGRNLLNEKIYRYLGYPALGANGMIGVRFRF